jgi:hypothetical protein
MAEYLSQKELVKAIEANLNQLEAGTFSISEIESHLNLVRELYERTLVFRYKAFENHSSVDVSNPTPKAEEVLPLIEAQAPHQEEEASIEPIITNEVIEESAVEETETVAEIEFDFFSSNEPEPIEEVIVESDIEEELEEVSAFSQIDEPEEQPTFSNQEEAEEEQQDFEAPVVSEQTSGHSTKFTEKVFKVEKEIRNQIGFNALPSLIGSFGLNERLLYINELFDGSSESFSDAIKHLDSRSNLSDAAVYVEDLALKFNWDVESEIVEEFIQKLCRRYA